MSIPIHDIPTRGSNQRYLQSVSSTASASVGKQKPYGFPHDLVQDPEWYTAACYINSAVHSKLADTHHNASNASTTRHQFRYLHMPALRGKCEMCWHINLTSALVSLSALPALKMNGTPAHRRFSTNKTHVANVGQLESFGTPSSAPSEHTNKFKRAIMYIRCWARNAQIDVHEKYARTPNIMYLRNHEPDQRGDQRYSSGCA